jgi:cell division protein FtsW (lipid II flippase)
MPKILGREPALWLALVGVLVKALAAFGMNVSADQQALINALAAAIVGLVVAFLVHDGGAAAVLGLVQAAIALAVGYGLDWSADQQAVAMSLVAAAVAMWTRTQVTAPVPAKAPLPPLTVAPDVYGE